MRLLVREARAEGMREAGEAVGDDEESEGEELRKAVEVSDVLSEVLERIKLTLVLFVRSQRASRRTKTKWRIPEDEHAFEPAELDEWEDAIVWGSTNENRCVAHRFLLSRRFPDSLR